jgi:tellurite resistance protein
MQYLRKPLTKEEKERLHEILHSDEGLDEFAREAVKGRREDGRRTRKPA